MQSQLLSLVRLGINGEELAEKVKKNKNLARSELERSWEDAIPIMIENEKQINSAVTYLLYNRNFCRRAGIEYTNISEYDRDQIRLAVSQYLSQTCQRKK